MRYMFKVARIYGWTLDFYIIHTCMNSLVTISRCDSAEYENVHFNGGDGIMFYICRCSLHVLNWNWLVCGCFGFHLQIVFLFVWCVSGSLFCATMCRMVNWLANMRRCHRRRRRRQCCHRLRTMIMDVNGTVLPTHCQTIRSHFFVSCFSFNSLMPFDIKQDL